MMISLLAKSLLVAGSMLLAGALNSVRGLIQELPPGSVRTRWYCQALLIGLFLLGYGWYGLTFRAVHRGALDLLVPAIFFLGACYVWLTANLAFRTALDVRRTTRLELETVTDPLTGLYNRRYLDRRLAQESAQAMRYKVPLSAVFLDIDHFKRINDQHGHQAGDEVLRALGSLLRTRLRETDVLTRYGGEEFVILTPHTDLLGATEIAQRLLDGIEAHPFELPKPAPPLQVTCSAGVASLEEGFGSPQVLLQAADDRLYTAKRQGRNRVVSTPSQPISSETALSA